MLVQLQIQYCQVQQRQVITHLQVGTMRMVMEILLRMHSMQMRRSQRIQVLLVSGYTMVD